LSKARALSTVRRVILGHEHTGREYTARLARGQLDCGVDIIMVQETYLPFP